VKRAVFLATVALLAMLILAPMAMGQGTTVLGGPMTPNASEVSGVQGDGGALGFDGSLPASGSPAPNPPLEDTGGPALLLPVASLLLGSGILTYANLRRG